MGDHDFKPTPTGQIVLDFLKGAMPAYIDTGLNVVHVRDVAEGHLLACERGAAGERYILGCGEYDPGADSRELAAITGTESSHYRIALLRRMDRGRGHHRLGASTGTPPRAPLEAVRMAKKKMWVSHAKAARELGYAPRPADAGAGRTRWRGLTAETQRLHDWCHWFSSPPTRVNARPGSARWDSAAR